jgi:hypothetical protein
VFLVATDLPILLNDLMKQINTKKPENPWQYSAIYFKKVQQCIHVLGSDYLTIVSCRHNRRSFVYCCQQSFQHFPPQELTSVNDFYSLLQLICPDIPLSLIHDSAVTGCITHQSDSNSSSNPPLHLFTFEELSYSLYFRFIFTEWLIMIENLFFDGTVKTRKSSATITIPISRLQSKIAEWTDTLPITTSQPTAKTLQFVYDEWSQRRISEITFDELIQSLLRNPHFKAETVAYQPKNSSHSQQQHTNTADVAASAISTAPPLIDQLLTGTMAPNLAAATTASGQIGPSGAGRLTGTSDGNLSLESSHNLNEPTATVLSSSSPAANGVSMSLLPGIK